MYITFLIGNGFDINIGLNTRYSDFYKYFEENANERNMIRNWIKEEKYLWSDLEIRLGQKVAAVNKESLDQFYQDKIELDELLIRYLEIEQERFRITENNKSVIEKEFVRSIKELTDGFSRVDQELIKNAKDYSRNETYEYQFITFNYTDILNRIVDSCKKDNVDIGSHMNSVGNKMTDRIGNVFHIHGTIMGEAILGVNDVTQIDNEFLRSERDFTTTFVKEQVNRSLGQQRTERASQIISKSQIICVFGMSIGSSDRMWWQKLVDWLLESNNRKLVIFWKGNEKELERAIPTRVILLKNRIINNFMNEGKGIHSEEKMDKIRSQIIVAFNSRIFSFPKVKA